MMHAIIVYIDSHFALTLMIEYHHTEVQAEMTAPVELNSKNIGGFSIHGDNIRHC